MTFKEEIAAARSKTRDNLWKDMTDVEIDRIIDNIDDIDNRIHELESAVVNLNLRMDSIDRT